MLLGILLVLVTASHVAAAVRTFVSSTSLAIPAGAPAVTAGPASTYPLTVVVSGLGPVSSLFVTLRSLTHTFPEDLDILLVGPRGQTVMLMSDAGGGGDIVGIDLQFGDGGIPMTTSQLVGGFYRPTDFQDFPPDAFPSPAPAGPYGNALSVFTGTNPNGAWSLYVVDDAGDDVGSLVEFSVSITADASELRRRSDFDGDGRSDLTVYRPSTGVWHVLRSSNKFTVSDAYQWGLSTDIPAPGDYDGDGKTDPAVFRPSNGMWLLLLSSLNYSTTVFGAYQWGTSTDRPVPGDYDGDGRTDIAFYRPATGVWHILTSRSSFLNAVSYQWGTAADVPVPGDFSSASPSDGVADIAVYRPATGVWSFLHSTTGYNPALATTYQWGAVGDVPLPGEFFNASPGANVYRPSTGTWHLLRFVTPLQVESLAFEWGLATDTPVLGDFDGDGLTDIAFFRPATGVWFILRSSTGFNPAQQVSYQWGASTDQPVLAAPSPVLPPTVVTTVATNITATGATFNASVNPNGGNTTVMFQYDDLSGYRFQVPAPSAPGSGFSPVAVSATTAGLNCGVAHHFRPVATNSAGTTIGAEAVFTTGACPTLSVDRGDPLKPLRYAATKSGASGALTRVTPAQVVTVSVTSGAQSWTASADKAWVGLTNASASGSGQFTVTIINPLDVLGGATSHTATITVTSGALSVAVGVVLTVDVGGSSTSPPFGHVDTPAHLATGLVGAIAVTGWALDDLGVAKVQLWRNCVEFIDRPAGACAASVPGGPADFVYIGDAAFLPGARDDVETSFPGTPQSYKAGWGYLLSTNALPHLPSGGATGGQGTFSLFVYAIDIEGQYTLLAERDVSLSNDTATIPFGSIDTPEQGGLVTSPVFASFGWAMTQNPKCIEVTSTAAYKVYIDGVSRTLTPGVNWFSGLTRPDIEAAYPGRCNTNNALAAYYIDAAALGLSNGLHTTGWDAIDNQGNLGGFGSRFFNLLVGSSLTASSVAEPPGNVGSGFSRIPVAVEGSRIPVLNPMNDRPTMLGSSERLTSLAAAMRPVRVRAGGDESPFVAARPDAHSLYHVQMPAGGRISLDLGGPMEAGYQVSGDDLRALPIGSTFEAASGQFFWQPPLPFFGPFQLVFVSANERIDVQATITDPTAVTAVAMHIDTPASGATVDGSFVVAGWALDPHATAGSGIDTLHVWAYRRDGVAAPQFLGAAAVGGARPDVATTHGAQFELSGFSLTTLRLAPGVYELLVYPWSHRTGRFEEATSVQIVVR